MFEMTDKQMAKKKKEFIEYLQGERVYLGKAGQEIDAYDYILRTEEEVWQWIEKLVEEVEESLSQNSDFLLKATRDLEQKSCNHMTNLEYYNGTIQCTRCYKFLTGKEYIKVLNNCGIGN